MLLSNSVKFIHYIICEQKAQDDILDSGQEEEYNKVKQKPKKSFAEFKF